MAIFFVLFDLKCREEWSYLDGAYFSFVTLSTIGFGDLVPGAKVLNAETRQLIGCILYLVNAKSAQLSPNKLIQFISWK